MMISHRLSCASGQWYFRRRSTTRIVVEGILRGRVAQEGRKCSSKRGKRLVDEGSYAWVGGPMVRSDGRWAPCWLLRQIVEAQAELATNAPQ